MALSLSGTDIQSPRNLRESELFNRHPENRDDEVCGQLTMALLIGKERIVLADGETLAAPFALIMDRVYLDGMPGVGVTPCCLGGTQRPQDWLVVAWED